ncbi:hypothetical protein O6H91_01G119900 [Diphasiastrum complanatum]|uniref:Uncharacterized protein n=1 Tax=Diphasiastrum complanatum TaxID=34168 RepID=A0ACC2EVG3_DIPCM|nr:hypothetical protein O6H91_01G119900 [Diphasiastrum complanatum]
MAMEDTRPVAISNRTTGYENGQYFFNGQKPHKAHTLPSGFIYNLRSSYRYSFTREIHLSIDFSKFEATNIQGQTKSAEKLWPHNFADSIQWQDTKFDKWMCYDSQKSVRQPDFVQKRRMGVLCMDSSSNPPWVNTKLRSGQSRSAEQVWERFFSNPSEWWDHRPDKMNASYPDFKHKATRDALWVDGRSTPQWVRGKLAALSPGTLQRSPFTWNLKIARYVKDGQHRKALNLFKQMQIQGAKPDKFTFTPILKACTSLGAWEEGYVKCRQGTKALELYRQLQQTMLEPDSVTFVGILSACASIEALEEGRRVHAHLIQCRCDSDVIVRGCLVDMYAKCGSLDDACRVFNLMPVQDVISWNQMLAGFVKCGEGRKALKLFHQMQRECLKPDAITLLSVLNACANVSTLQDGRNVHAKVVQLRCESDVFIQSGLIDMYWKCGSIEDACRVFNQIPTIDVASWNAMMAGFVKCGQAKKALKLFKQMCLEQVKPDIITFVSVLNSCASLAALEEGRAIHAQVIESGCESDAMVRSALIDMYAKCGKIEQAHIVFNSMPTQDVVSWNAMIAGFVKCGQGWKALEIFQQMQKQQVEPDKVTHLGALNACSSVRAIAQGRRIHASIIACRCELDTVLGSCLIDMYAKCGSIEDAQRVFWTMPMHDVVSWSAVIIGCVNCGQAEMAFNLFEEMQMENVEPDSVTFVGAVNACTGLLALDKGRFVHAQILKSGCGLDVVLENCLIDMYAKCGSIEEAWTIFMNMSKRDVVSWSTMIMGLVKCGQGEKALDLFQYMQSALVEPDMVTFIAVLGACASVCALEEGRNAHMQIVEKGYESNIIVQNCLLAMYCKCESIDDAYRVFSIMPRHDVVSWSTMLSGYAKLGQGVQALQLFGQMQQEGLKPDVAIFVAVLNACASVAALEEGRHVHAQAIRNRSEGDVEIGSCLIDMYAKCGDLEDACRVFRTMPIRDVFGWNAMLNGYALHGLGNKTRTLFEEMCEEGFGMDSVTFVCLFSACSHAGLVDEGLCYFESLVPTYAMSVTLQHYGCMVDLLGRAGHLYEAEETIKKMPLEPNISVWMALLGACRVHENVDMGERVAKKVLELDPKNASGYVLLANIYAAIGKWDSRLKVQQMRQEKQLTNSKGLLGLK